MDIGGSYHATPGTHRPIARNHMDIGKFLSRNTGNKYRPQSYGHWRLYHATPWNIGASYHATPWTPIARNHMDIGGSYHATPWTSIARNHVDIGASYHATPWTPIARNHMDIGGSYHATPWRHLSPAIIWTLAVLITQHRGHLSPAIIWTLALLITQHRGHLSPVIISTSGGLTNNATIWYNNEKNEIYNRLLKDTRDDGKLQ